ncbi:MAG: type II toxin-antitoxin system prevent-host-death family antitoxin [Comamonadaceae bacterium]|nr:MAG: type II toxin-antitoxin system prevent-host-death family antitoxin [Comamonadaceae bacterium]
MSIHTVPSRDFARDVSNAKRLATQGPVFITDRGRPAFALLKIEDYYELTGKKELSLLQLMDSVSGGDFEFDQARIPGQLRTVEFD